MTDYKLPIMGARFRKPAPALLSIAAGGTAMILRPEPENEHDNNAVAIYLPSSSMSDRVLELGEDTLSNAGLEASDIRAKDLWHVGYIPKEIASWMQARLAGKDHPAKLAFLVDGKPAVEFQLQLMAVANNSEGE